MVDPPEGVGTVAPDERIAGLLTDLEPADFERLDPPAGLWGRVSESIAADTRARDRRSDELGMVVEYRIDAADVVTWVGESWAAFAEENDAGQLSVPDHDRTLWSYFGSDEIRDLWRLIVERVRADRLEMQLPLRCDGADTRRWFEITVSPEAAGGVHFRSTLVKVEARPNVTLLDSGAERDPDVAAVPLCSWCGHGYDGARWLEIGQLVRESRLLEATAMPPRDLRPLPDLSRAHVGGVPHAAPAPTSRGAEPPLLGRRRRRATTRDRHPSWGPSVRR